MTFSKVDKVPWIIPLTIVDHPKLGYVNIQTDRNKLYFNCEAGHFETKLDSIVDMLYDVAEVLSKEGM